uniref:Neuroligin-4, Y-linked-like n=2 Tax=Diabrotica TaxID=50385 RepID=A0A6P7FXL1_DIAVI
MRNTIRQFLFFSFFFLLFTYPSKSDMILDSKPQLTSRTVRTKYGDVSGVIFSLDSKYLEPVEVFRGIPYASPPLGSLRFMPPVTGALWQGVKLADRFSPVCPQRLPDISNETAALRRMPKGRLEYLKRLLPYLKEQSEDCLYLNIYAPAQGRINFLELIKKYK